MAGEIIEITPENDPRSRPEATAFANQHAALLAEHAIQNNDQTLQHRTVGVDGFCRRSGCGGRWRIRLFSRPIATIPAAVLILFVLAILALTCNLFPHSNTFET
jgi:hypothetical protein